MTLWKIKKKVVCSLFADDLALYIITRALKISTRKLPRTENYVWAMQRGPKLKPIKRVAMVF